MRIRTLKVIAVVMILMMLINVIPISAFAEDNIVVSDKMVLSVSSVNGIPGGTTQVSVILKNNPGIASLKFNIEYDDALTLTDVAFDSSFGPYVTTPKPYVNPQTITLISPLTDISAEGILATLTFNVSEEVPDGYVADINIAYDVDDVYNGNYDSVALDVVNGRVTVYDGIPGDIDGDSKVGTQDAIILFRYIAGWSVDVDPNALDVNGDNKINSKDAITLFRYVAGWENIELHRGKTCAHELTHIPETAATCKENGQIAHWQCSLCSKYFGDENAAVEVSVEDMVIPATGHTEVIDEAVAPTHDSTGLTEGKHCSVCNTVLLEQQVVPKLEASYHSITYKNIKAAESPDQTSYAEHEGLLDLPEISVPGYKFLGWYTASENGSKIDYILAGDTKDYVLFAHWELVSYTITYQDAPVNNNPSTYTIEDEIVLKNAEWSGLMFVNWTDNSGNSVSKIEKGTTGEVVLTANWKSYRNNVVPVQNSKLLSAYRDDMGLYYFAYKLGTIENVVVSSITSPYNKTTNIGRDLTLGNTINTSETDMSTIANTINNSVTNTKNWTDTTTWAKTQSATGSFTNTLSFGGSIGTKDVWNFGINDSMQIGFTWGGNDTNGRTTVEGKSESSTTGSVLSTSSTISYSKTMSVTESTEISVSGDMPNGLYDYVYTTDIIVYGIVIYNANDGNYCVSTYSTTGDLSTTLMYYKQPSDKYDIPCDDLPFNINTDKIEKTVSSFYYVKYDANGGKGDMPVSLHPIGSSSNLAENKLTRDGYIFEGWGVHSDAQTSDYKDMQSITDLANGGETVTLYAKWSVDPYNIGKYVENGSVVSDSDGGKTYIVYNDITHTPQSTEAGYIHIVDWSGYTGTMNYIESVTQEDGTRYGGGNVNHDIANIDEVYFIGNPDAVFTNMYIYHVNYEQYSTVPTIHFVDFNISDSAFRVYIAEGMISPHKSMIFDIDGKCSIKASAGNNAIEGFDNITFTGSGTLEIYGGNGADGSSAGASGTNGGAGIIAGNITVDMTGELNVYGGNGGHGKDGQSAGKASDGQSYIGRDTDDKTGGYGNNAECAQNGGNGGNGGAGISTSGGKVNLLNGTVYIFAGIGGNGGNGGISGNGIECGTFSIGDSQVTIEVYGNGAGGNGGHGGNGGNGGAAGSCLMGVFAGYKSGTGGCGGNAGRGGCGGTSGFTALAISGTWQPNNVTVKYSGINRAGVGGNGGRGGNGGNAGQETKWDSADDSYKFAGYSGNGGDAGASGNFQIAGLYIQNIVGEDYIAQAGSAGSAGTPGMHLHNKNGVQYSSNYGQNGNAASKGTVEYIGCYIQQADVYNNLLNGTVVHNWVDMDPTSSVSGSQMLQITTSGEASPGLGGFVTGALSEANKVYYHVIVAKVPVGYQLQYASNAVGDETKVEWLTSNEGTGSWQTYVYKMSCGLTGTFQDFGYVYLTGQGNVTWYVAYSSIN